MRVSHESCTSLFRASAYTNFADPCNEDQWADGWLAEVYRYESSEHLAQRSFQRLAYRIKRRKTSKAQ